MCLDGYMNIAMEQTEEYVNGQLKANYGECFIRGNNGELGRMYLVDDRGGGVSDQECGRVQNGARGSAKHLSERRGNRDLGCEGRPVVYGLF